MKTAFSPSRRSLEWWAQIAGLAATCWVVWDTALAGRRDVLSKIADGFGVSLGAWIWAAVMVWLLRVVIRHLSNLEVAPATMRASTVGVWFAPATLLMMDSSPMTITAALVLTIGATRLLSVPSPDGEARRFDVVSVMGGGELPVDLFAHHFGAALLAGAGIQGALALSLMRHRAFAAGLVLLSIAILTTLAIGLGAWVQRSTPNLPRSILGLCLTVLLAIMGGRMVRGFGGRGSGSGSGSGDSASGAAAAGQAKGKYPAQPPLPDLHLPGTFPGVILWPAVKPVTVLIAPLPAAHGPSSARPAHPLSIPFGGEYWMYRRPFLRPPPNSFFRRGSPEELSFSTPDFAPLQMEAHQKLEQAISMHCCSSIQVEILNGEQREPDVFLELVAFNAETGKPRSQSLGWAQVKSTPETREGRTNPVRETLEFPIHSNPAFDEFDELEVVFHRGTARSHSARIAIERFVLVP